MSLGITVGKFHPYHLGHDHLIRTAKARVDRMAVMVGDRSDQSVPGAVRAEWIREMHPDVEVIVTPDDLPEAPEPWARRVLEVLGVRPDVAFTSEDYGESWARAMGARHESVDPARKRVPISGSQLRSDLGTHWEMLTPPAKAYFARRVCLTGAESTGKTTLAQTLAEKYRTAWVPEYGRWYWEGRRYTGEDWTSGEFARIARGQGDCEDDLARRANRVLICDTSALTTRVWHRRYLGADSENVPLDRKYALYLVTAPDFAHVQDGTRESRHLREEMHEWTLAMLSGQPHIVLTGPIEKRLKQASEAIGPLLSFSPIR